MEDALVHVRPSSQVSTKVTRVEDGRALDRLDRVASEEPLEIRIVEAGRAATVAVTMRTPGNDFELAAGFLYGEGVIKHVGDIQTIRYCSGSAPAAAQRYNIVNVTLRPGLSFAPSPLERHFFTSSACGVCGKAGLDMLALRGMSPLDDALLVDAGVICSLPEALRRDQILFAATGGLHAAAAFDRRGELLAVREDVGRHNAVDKLIGWAALSGKLPLNDAILMLSGRASFEIVQKALAARIPAVCAVSAPSSLAVSLARRFDMTLIGFVRGARFNIYAGAERIALQNAAVVAVAGS
ncbi:MAG: formate dehydrogenase accessory sulfurtransferase FdhD [Candidatus Eremiobacteraeota bacterium]|nr:formate dehydrogenase accessory sulfurtransferase FdhD [Candidatus Eremiobacteraeota bacterium]